MLSTIKSKKHFAGELFREVKLKLRLNHPHLTHEEVIFRRIDLYRDESGGEDVERELDTLHHYTMHNEIGSFQSWREALVMAQMLHHGDTGLPSFAELMIKTGFSPGGEIEPVWEHTNQRGLVQSFHNSRVKALALNLFPDEGTFDVNLDRQNGIYNLGMLCLYGRDFSSNKLNALPSHIEDYRRVGLHWVDEIIRLRRDRGGLFRKPTGFEHDPFPVGLPD